ncbi:N-acetyllactosaminide beta-1,3-N-acetylglucosaminyltransferase 3-like [Petromyzon marinus]|uniref:N-acetyllactosaminide beta-1,3-N-acetylglucosaminyltransferase 3-like n=1 Tax=Petromyzon marinus TaxID=7757 RepID=UPI003F7022CC
MINLTIFAKLLLSREASFFLLLLAGFGFLVVFVTVEHPNGPSNVALLNLPKFSGAGDDDAAAAWSAERLLPGPKCLPNDSVQTKFANFAWFPSHIQRFLAYRHCRSFPLLVDQADKCRRDAADGERPVLLLVIKSRPEHYYRRMAIRHSYGQQRETSGVVVRRLFIMGLSSNKDFQRLVRYESATYKDVLQWAFDEAFFNLTLKQVLFMAWFQRRCTDNATFVYNGDDDMFLNTERLASELRFLPMSEDLYAGLVIRDTERVNTRMSKYYVPEEMHSSNAYPPYVSGGSILMTAATVRKFYGVSHEMELYPIDDVFFGFCADRLGIATHNHHGFRTWGLRSRGFLTGLLGDRLPAPCSLRQMVAVHKFKPKELLQLWKQLQATTEDC